MVRMTGPDGTQMDVPSENVDIFVQNGWQ
jgi:hypothetical protein